MAPAIDAAGGRLATAEALGLTWAIGGAGFTSLFFALYWCGVPCSVAVWPALLVTLVTAAFGLRALGRCRCRGTTLPTRMSVVVAALTMVVAALQVVYAARQALQAPFGSFDAWSFWEFKARMFATMGPPASYFHDQLTVYTHPNYPLNLSLLEAGLLRLPAPFATDVAALVGVACLAALLLIYYVGVTRLYGASVGALAAAALTLVPAVTVQAAGGDADVPLSLYFGGSVLYLALWWRLRRPADAVLMGLLSGGAAWTKKEGLPLAAIVLVAYVLGEWRGNPVRAPWPRIVALPLLAALLLPLPWLLFLVATHPIGNDVLPFTPTVLADHLYRVPHILARFALEPLVTANWSFFWPCVVGSVIVAARRLSWIGRGLLVLLLGELCVYGMAFLFSTWQPYTLHIQASLDRLYVQAVPLALLLLLEALRSVGVIGAGDGVAFE